MKILTAQATLIAGDSEKPLKRLHHCCLAGTIHANKRCEAGCHIDPQWFGAKAPKIDQSEPLDKHLVVLPFR
jgi:hypothetical protein